MRGLPLILAAALALTVNFAGAAPAAAKPDRAEAFAEPGDIIAAEGAFQHLRTEKGPRAAIRATAQVDAQTYAPLAIRVADYLKGRTEPSLPPTWQPHQVWMSCDGSYAVAYGAWQQPAATGWYATVWHRQKGGAYKWVLDLGDPLETALAAPEMIVGSVADCPERRPRKIPGATADHPAPPLLDYSAGLADDGTLAWSTTGELEGPRGFIVQLKQNGALHEVLRAGLPPAPRKPVPR